MSDVPSVMAKLDDISTEINTLSTQLADMERAMEPVAEAHEAFISDFEIGLWTAHVEQDKKLPPQGLRDRMAHRAMPPELYGRYVALNASRKRIEKRLASLKVACDAQRSILSALKTELEATR